MQGLLRAMGEAAALGLTIVLEVGSAVADVVGGVLRNGRHARGSQTPSGGNGDTRGVLHAPPVRYETAPEGCSTTPSLPDAFEELLERSRDPRCDDEEHPAFRNVLSQISPDEARILKVFAARGEYPLIHVLATPRYGWTSRLVLENFTRIAEESGCHHPDRVPAYLDNLCRLGLLRVYDECGLEPGEYELLEVHPVVKAATRHIRDETGERPRFERKIVRLTALGRALCAACLP